MDKQTKHLSSATIGLMVGVALFYDTLQWLLSFLLMSWIVTPVAYLTFLVWFKMHGLSFLSLKRAPTLGIGLLLELIPIGIFPALTFTVARIALDNKLKS